MEIFLPAKENIPANQSIGLFFAPAPSRMFPARTAAARAPGSARPGFHHHGIPAAERVASGPVFRMHVAVAAGQNFDVRGGTIKTAVVDAFLDQAFDALFTLHCRHLRR